MSILTVRDLKKYYGSKLGGSICRALNGISLDIEDGEFVGIMGPSGAGKTTLLNIIAAIDDPSSGSVILDGNNIHGMKGTRQAAFRRDTVGFVFQDFNLLDTLTLRENIILPLTISKTSVKLIDERVEKLTSMLGIKDILDNYPYEVSSGQRQRTAAARAVINNPRLVLADEPTGALDSKASRELLQCFTDLNEQHNTTILMVTHDAFAASYCKRIIFIKDGLVFTEIAKGGGSRKEFFDKVLEVLGALGGETGELL